MSAVQTASDSQSMVRHAIYFVPPAGHALWAAGQAWLQPQRPHTAAPRRYGFHATLKPPMRLADGVDDAVLHQRVAALAARLAPFDMPALQVGWLGAFLALRPVQPVPPEHPLQALADACVTQLDDLRAPPTAAELARRQPQHLGPRQRELLQRYAYPHVLDEWRFHMTLTDPLAELGNEAAHAVAMQAREHFAAALRVPLRCEQIALCVEPRPGGDFELRCRFDLGCAP